MPTEATVSEFDKLRDSAEQYAKEHPEQVQKAEQGAEHAVESRLGLGDQQGQDEQGQGQQGQDQQDQGGGQQDQGN
jgi:hypothetical protein